MFIGHFAVAFAAKRAAPEVSLGTLFMAAQLADLIWPTLVLLGLERFEVRPGITAVTPLDFVHYPYSHSLVALVAWGALLGAAFVIARKGRFTTALLLAAIVVSHWLLDVATHRPDMPLTLGGTERLGFGLWNSIVLTAIVEGTLFAVCLYIYSKRTQPVDATGRWAYVGLVVFLVVIYIANLWGPPPPSTTAVAWSAQAIWLIVAWAYWIDRHRIMRRR
jgi:FtsH-binding integral membrane protein